MLLNRSTSYLSRLIRPMSMSATMTSSDKSSPMNTVNQEEVEKFRKLSESWWDLNGPLAALHSMNQLRVPLIRDGLIHTGRAKKETATPLSGLNILDVGCGGGILSERLARLGANVTGIDAVHENVMGAREHAKKDGAVAERINYRHTTIENLVEENPGLKFDAVVASEVIEHVDNPQFFVDSCSSLLQPGGSFFVTTLSRTTRSWLGAIVAAESILGIVPPGTHDWNKFLTPEELTAILSNAKLRTRLTHGMLYVPGLNKWSWFPDTAINYAVHAIKTE